MHPLIVGVECMKTLQPFRSRFCPAYDADCNVSQPARGDKRNNGMQAIVVRCDLWPDQSRCLDRNAALLGSVRCAVSCDIAPDSDVAPIFIKPFPKHTTYQRTLFTVQPSASLSDTSFLVQICILLDVGSHHHYPAHFTAMPAAASSQNAPSRKFIGAVVDEWQLYR